MYLGDGPLMSKRQWKTWSGRDQDQCWGGCRKWSCHIVWTLHELLKFWCDCIIMQYWHPRRKAISFLLLLVWIIKTSSSIYLKFPAICRGNSRIFGVRKHLNFRPVGSCDWCPAPPSSYGFFAALVFGGELPNGFLFEIAAGFIHRENRLHRRFSFEI